MPEATLQPPHQLPSLARQMQMFLRRAINSSWKVMCLQASKCPRDRLIIRGSMHAYVVAKSNRAECGDYQTATVEQTLVANEL
eukprot:936276-Amphidinium_carterae.1